MIARPCLTLAMIMLLPLCACQDDEVGKWSDPAAEQLANVDDACPGANVSVACAPR